MAKKTKQKRKKSSGKQKKQQKRKAADDFSRFKRSYFFFDKGVKLWDDGKLPGALSCFLKALKAKPPENEEMLRALVELGTEMKRSDVILHGSRELLRTGHLRIEEYGLYINTLMDEGKYVSALEVIGAYRQVVKTSLRHGDKRKHLNDIAAVESYCRQQLRIVKRKKNIEQEHETRLKKKQAGQPWKTSPGPSDFSIDTVRKQKKQKISPGLDDKQPSESIYPEKVKKQPDIPVTIKLDRESFSRALGNGKTVKSEVLQVTIDAHLISFRNSFDNLICLPLLQDIQSFWYQEETVRKVLKTFRGRAMLADEVGLGKTIEAGMVLKEYIVRGMVKNALILTPTPLVSQWKEELQSKFGLDFTSTDDPGVRINDRFWQRPFVLASINQAKSKKNFSSVTAREYDMVIVDEAHHLKNKTTLNWKLVNSLKKRFLLFLTATPVENNLMELYNLITLLKPGLLKTGSDFKKEFMTQGDTVSPRNRTRLRSLLDQVMIRNTRALAALNIPPRFAQTVRINPVGEELRLYEMVTNLVSRLNRQGDRKNRMLLKTLLAEAGSSPRALSLTLRRLLQRDDKRFMDCYDQIEAIRTLCRSITGETGKNKALVKLIGNTRGKKIVFVKFLGSLEEISDYLSWHNISFATFHGSMTNREKDEAIELFRTEKDILITTEIGGEGRNLQFCHQMINYDLPWNPMKIEQRIGRIHRLGQENEVMIYNFCGKGSLEEYIIEILDKKINMFEMVIGEIDMILGRMRGEKDFEEMVYEIWVNEDSEEARRKEFVRLGARMKRSRTQYGTTRELDEKLFGTDYEL
ncbi:MAG: DEAD/DEAH box helicase [Desulfobulbaceae bacterium]|nr:DEAD/DEAH box helicase [Desulfobulbaceae bacterium]